MSEGTPNPQINVSKIPGGGGFAGALFAVISTVILLTGIPSLRCFFPAAVILGCGIALILRFVRRETPGKPWILLAPQDADSTDAQAHRATGVTKPEDLRRKLRALSPA
jgi:hypothetical protein